MVRRSKYFTQTYHCTQCFDLQDFFMLEYLFNKHFVVNKTLPNVESDVAD